MKERLTPTPDTVEKAGCVPIRKRPSPSPSAPSAPLAPSASNASNASNAHCPSDQWEVLLIQSRWRADVWAFPKGSVEHGELPLHAAIRETKEEAGVVGNITDNLGCVMLNANTQMRMFLLVVHQQFDTNDVRWMERDSRKRKWVSFSKARTLLHPKPQLLRLLESTIDLLASCSPLNVHVVDSAHTHASVDPSHDTGDNTLKHPIASHAEPVSAPSSAGSTLSSEDKLCK